MRTLLIDNYDSFTYNLCHQIAEVSGSWPVVLRNDAQDWHRGMLDSFDNVVISPGPGDPAIATDFGICREVVEHTEIPLLGVCLGHQGLALAHGATVSRAPEPRHGRLSPVVHRGTGLFAGLPSPFEVVRYHSLAVSDLPDDLEAVAWTPDGVVMAVEHRERPMWGVQFHPESVLTRYGHELMANFMRLTRSSGGAPPAPGTAGAPAPALEVREAQEVHGVQGVQDVEGVSQTAPTRHLRVLTEALPTRWDDEVAFDRLFRSGPYAFWLDSGRPGASDTSGTGGAVDAPAASGGRFSIMGDASGPLARVAKADVSSRTVTIRSGHDTQVFWGTFLDWLDADLRSARTEVPSLPCDFALGWVGYLGYELKAECGGAVAHRSDDADAVMVFADRAVVFDHTTRTTHLLALAEDGDESAAREWLRATADTLESSAGLSAEPVSPAPDDLHGGELSEIRLRHDREAYLRLIAHAQEQIAAGETYEVCLTNMAEVQGTLDPWEGYRLLRRHSPAPYGALLGFGPLAVLSTSPERLLRVSADGAVESRPIKGTRPRGATPAEDAALAAELRSDEKDLAENLMIVDLVRNDLGRCAESGSVEAVDIFRVETYATVHQLVSPVRAQLRSNRTAVDCVRSCFPAGSMTGAPKIRTMQIIDRLEAGPRGVYSGAIGYFSLTGAADLSVVIRTALVTPDRVRYGVGGAVIALSDPEAEYEETAVKAGPFLALTGRGFPARVR
ncbi:aminodeoxychorismate synthase component I [Streptomyces sp. NPDC059828]|uniref:aminodeoxychorismate synthase component I n=1 Tax=Streptomyces sp. NPDC059828 TaxID=3346965 RepID=UPI00365E918B